MRETIKNFHTQFSYEPEVVNAEGLKHFGKFTPHPSRTGEIKREAQFAKGAGFIPPPEYHGRKPVDEWGNNPRGTPEYYGREPMVGGFIIAGMGGSNLVAGLLKIRDPYLDVMVHKNYGLPALSHDELRERLLIANSYSGNTEEIIDSLEHALKEGLPVSAIATGGKLLELAQKHKIPYIQMPQTNIQPRSALGFNMKAVLKIMAREDLLDEASSLANSLKPSDIEEGGKEFAAKLNGRIPIIYSSGKNEGIAYAWKIKFNETGKVPAFYNTFPELNHTEMTGFDPVRALTAVSERPTSNGASVLEERKKLNEPFHFIFLKDAEDSPQIKKRMEITEKMYGRRELSVEAVELKGENIFQKIFSSLVLADWTSYYLGKSYGVETGEVPMVEEFKGLIQK